MSDVKQTNRRVVASIVSGAWLIVTFSVCGCGGNGEAQTAAALEQLWAKVEWSDDGHVVSVDFTGSVNTGAATNPESLKLFINDSDLKLLASLSKLERLNLNFGMNITDAGLTHLRELTSLQELQLGNTQASDSGLEFLSRLENLRLLELHGTNVTDRGLRHLNSLTNLRTLDLGDTKITDAGLQQLAGLVNLEELRIGGTQITNGGLRHLNSFEKLKCLELNQTAVTNSGLANLSSMTGLKELDLYRTRITDAGLQHLAVLTNLETLYLRETPITRAAVNRLRQTLPKCKYRAIDVQQRIRTDDAGCKLHELRSSHYDSHRH